MQVQRLILASVFLSLTLIGNLGLAWAQEPKIKSESTEPSTIPEITEEHFRIFRGDGSTATLDDILQAAQSVEVIFLGEYHDDPVAHFLEKQVLSKLIQQTSNQNQNLALSMEMFERDVQHILDEYLSGLISENHLTKSGRTWTNYESDYRPLVELAKQNGVPVIAANAPRRYVNLVGRQGRDALLQIKRPADRGLPPLPYAQASKAYANKFNNLMEKFRKQRAEAAKKSKPESTKQESSANKTANEDEPQKLTKQPNKTPTKKPTSRGSSLDAQSLWDAAMAYSIVEQFLRDPGCQVVHINGSFHTEKKLGIPEHLLRYRPSTSFLVVTMFASDSFPAFDSQEMINAGDFVIVTDNSLPRSYDFKTKK
ncbi:MAG: ChaN family lipoprotein [Planctomycetota bacterium]